jgi:hypothetical protein
MAWCIEEAEHLEISSLLALFHDEIAAIRIPCFLSPNACQVMIQKIYQHNVERYSDDPEMSRVGITQGEHMHEKDLYFLYANDERRFQEDIFEESRAVLFLVIHALRKIWQGNVDIAVEEGTHQLYFAGLIRSIRRTKLHFDWAPHDAKNWTIGRISAQIAWNAYLQSSERGGTTRVYHHLWQNEDERYREQESYAYHPSLVLEDEYVEIYPHPGDLVLFNSRNYHEVERTEGDKPRLSVSSFVGLLPSKQQLLLWS